VTAQQDHSGREGADALMAAITGEAPPREARSGEAFMAEYRSATADVALLREQLGLIGQALAEPGEAPGPETGGAAVTPLPARRKRPEPLAVAVKGLVAAVGASLVIGMGWLVVQSGGMSGGSEGGGSSAADSSAGRPHAEADSKLGHAGYLACARIVVEGTVAEVEAVPGAGQDRITLDVTRHYKPDKGRARITFPMESGAEPSLRAGDHVLVGISGGQAVPDMWATGEKEIARERAWITDALPASRTLPCP
jgi:anti-sigma factor RsiW